MRGVVFKSQWVLIFFEKSIVDSLDPLILRPSPHQFLGMEKRRTSFPNVITRWIRHNLLVVYGILTVIFPLLQKVTVHPLN